MDKEIVEKSRNKNVAILIPAYNEAENIKNVIEQCCTHNLDIIVVDDGSSDNTTEIVNEMEKKYSAGLFLIKHETNKGKGEALKTGFLFAAEKNYPGVVTLDADGQHNVSEITNFLETARKENPDIIVGSRFQNTRGMPFIRLAANFITSWLISIIASRRINDVQSGFRFIGQRVLKNIHLETKNFDTEPEILLKASWMNYKILNIPISTIYHKNFTSHVNPLTDTMKFFKLIFKSLVWKRKFKHSRTRL